MDSELTMLDRFQRAVLRKEIDKVPVCSVTQTGIMDLMNLTGTSWPKAFTDPGEMTALAMAGYEIAGLEAVRYPFTSFDLPLAFGCSFSCGTSVSQPHQTDFPCKTLEEAENFVVPDHLYENSFVQIMLETTDSLRRQIDEKGYELPLIAGIVGPTSLTSCLIGVNNFLFWCVREPDVLAGLFSLCSEICVEYANILCDRGADSVVIIDSECGPDLFPPPLFESMVLPLYKKMTPKMNPLNILHMCGDATLILDSIAESGFSAVSLEEKTDIGYASLSVGKDICLVGNVSPANEMLLQSPEAVKNAAKQCIEDGVGILAPGCGLAPYTPLSNVQAFVAARDEYYSEKSK